MEMHKKTFNDETLASKLSLAKVKYNNYIDGTIAHIPTTSRQLLIL